MIPGKCDTCNWWRRPGDTGNFPLSGESFGKCMAAPPTVQADGKLNWPIVTRTDWCGSHTRRY